MVSELAMRCPPLTVCGPASSAAEDHSPAECDQTVWNYSQTRLLDVVDVVGPSEAARLTDRHVRLIGDHTLGDGIPPTELTTMLRETVEQYIHRELLHFAADVIPALFDVFTGRQ